MKMRIKSITSFYLLYFLFVPISNCHVSHSHNEVPPRFSILANVLKFCEANGKKYISITSLDDEKNITSLRQYFIMLSLSQNTKIYSKTMPIHEAIEKANIREIENKIILVNYGSIHNNDNKVVENIIQLISKSKIRSCVLVISTMDNKSLDDNIDLQPFIDALSNLQQNLFFYLVHDHQEKDGGQEFYWSQVITLQNNPKVIFNQLAFDSEYRIKEM